jgi:AraC-like DNA-binding protein
MRIFQLICESSNLHYHYATSTVRYEYHHFNDIPIGWATSWVPMMGYHQFPTDGLFVWERHQLHDYTVVEPLLPVTELTVTQLGPGHLTYDVAVMKADDTTLVHARNNSILSLDAMVLDPAYTAFMLVAETTGECRINGELLRTSAIYMPGSENSFYVRGESRDVIGVALPRDTFIETIAALRGIGPEDVTLNIRSAKLTPIITERLRRCLLRLFDETHFLEPLASSRQTSTKMATKIFGLVCDAYLWSVDHTSTGMGTGHSPQWIVRKAEDRFLAAEAGPISLADLCMATGVSKSTLYNAFHSICGEPPLDYFRKRRLMKARSILIKSEPRRGAIKHSALTAGLTQLGRFSVEYRNLFGESPSTTLNIPEHSVIPADEPP